MTITLNASLVIPLLWAVWAIYWAIAARGVKAVVRRESSASRLGHAIPLTISGLLLWLPHVPGWLGERFVPESVELFLTSVGIIVAGLLLCVWARVVLGGNWSGTVTLKAEHEIVRAGPYRMVRHPIYTGLLLMFSGTALARGEWRGILAFVIAFAALWRKLRLEERWLTESFGAAYTEYRATTWALFPYLL